MSTISKAAFVFLVNSTELDIRLPLKIKTDEQPQKNETQPETEHKPLTPHSSTFNSLRNRISKIQNNTTAPNEFLVIAAKSAIQIDKKQLELYEHEPLIESNQLMIVDSMKKEEPVGSYILINNTARKIGIRNRFKKESEFIIPAFGNRRIDESILNQHDYGPWKDLNLIKKRRNPETFYTLLDPEGKPGYRMQRVLDALKDDEWLVYIQNWRNIGLCQDTLVTDPNDIIKEERIRA